MKETERKELQEIFDNFIVSKKAIADIKAISEIASAESVLDGIGKLLFVYAVGYERGKNVK